MFQASVYDRLGSKPVFKTTAKGTEMCTGRVAVDFTLFNEEKKRLLPGSVPHPK